MKQNTQKNKLQGAAGFDEYYGNLYGDRWNSLKSSLYTEPDYAEWKINGSEPYFLDSGSIRCAVSLPLEGAKKILDLCAAPGGKTLVLASNMESDAMLLSNERSPDRKNRLLKVCDTCLPSDVRERVEVCCKDGAKMCLSKNNEEYFDRILLDAPCSSERHVLLDQKYLDQWSPSRIKTLAMAQWALLSSAFRMLKKDGYLLYSTCSLATDENDGVVSRLVKKFSNAAVIPADISLNYKKFTKSDLPDCEKTEFGFHVLPDKQNGAGPLYFCLIKKN